MTPELKQIKKNAQQTTPKSVPQSEGIFGVAPLGATFGGTNRVWASKLGPSVPKVLQMIENEPNMTPKSPPIVKGTEKVKPFRSLAWRIARRAYNNHSRHEDFAHSLLMKMINPKRQSRIYVSIEILLCLDKPTFLESMV